MSSDGEGAHPVQSLASSLSSDPAKITQARPSAYVSPQPPAAWGQGAGRGRREGGAPSLFPGRFLARGPNTLQKKVQVHTADALNLFPNLSIKGPYKTPGL